VQTETIVFFLDNNTNFSSAVLIFGSRSMVALIIDDSLVRYKLALQCKRFQQTRRRPSPSIDLGQVAVFRAAVVLGGSCPGWRLS